MSQLAEPAVDRRRFLRATAAGCGLVSWWTLSACASSPALRAPVVAGRVRLTRQEVDAAFGAGPALLLQGDGLPEPIYLVRDSDAGLIAVGSTCAHLGCQVRPANTFFRCPCHGSTYTLHGAVVRGPATASLPRYGVRVDADHIEIELP